MKNKIITIILLIISIIAIIIILLRKNPDEFLKITPSENKTVEYETYTNDLISIEIPKTWKVITGGSYSNYSIKIYNPQNEEYSIFYNLKTEGYTKSEEAKKIYERLYPNSAQAKLPYIKDLNTESFYKIFPSLSEFMEKEEKINFYPKLNEFTTIQNLGKSELGGDIIRATYKTTNGLSEGIFTATVKSEGTYMMNGIDSKHLSVHNTVFITTPNNKLTNWLEVLTKCQSTLKFTNKFVTNYNRQSNTLTPNKKHYQKLSEEIINNWNKKETNYDIQNQKEIDKELNQERVIDTSTNEIYKAYKGFIKEYTGKKYKKIEDSQYLEPISGYINK